jgi:hypothetical protein
MTPDAKNLGEKGIKLYCEKCDFVTCDSWKYNRHISTSKHKKVDKELQKDDEKFLEKGEKGEKGENVGKEETKEKEKNEENNNTFVCCCGNQYAFRQGLWKHKKKCNFIIDNEKKNTNNSNDNNNDTSNKDDLIQYLINENKDFKNLILEVCKNFQGTNIMTNSHNVSNVNSHNKTFNLQFFLNETCKDAMNMSDFIDSMKLQLSDLESVGKLGFVDGISNIIIKNLEALDVEKRPVHCSDSKRETMYIKEHDKWEKEDNELKRMKDLVRNVRDRNISLIATWRDLYPECVKSNSKKTTQFNQICMEAFGGETGGEKGTKQEKEDKIISKIAKAMVIDKKD